MVQLIQSLETKPFTTSVGGKNTPLSLACWNRQLRKLDTLQAMQPNCNYLLNSLSTVYYCRKIPYLGGGSAGFPNGTNCTAILLVKSIGSENEDAPFQSPYQDFVAGNVCQMSHATIGWHFQFLNFFTVFFVNRHSYSVLFE